MGGSILWNICQPYFTNITKNHCFVWDPKLPFCGRSGRECRSFHFSHNSSPHPLPTLLPLLILYILVNYIFMAITQRILTWKVTLAEISFLAKSVTTFTETLGALRLGFHTLSTLSKYLVKSEQVSFFHGQEGKFSQEKLCSKPKLSNNLQRLFNHWIIYVFFIWVKINMQSFGISSGERSYFHSFVAVLSCVSMVDYSFQPIQKEIHRSNFFDWLTTLGSCCGKDVKKVFLSRLT